MLIKEQKPLTYGADEPADCKCFGDGLPALGIGGSLLRQLFVFLFGDVFHPKSFLSQNPLNSSALSVCHPLSKLSRFSEKAEEF